jgi:hypothetical protein
MISPIRLPGGKPETADGLKARTAQFQYWVWMPMRGELGISKR